MLTLISKKELRKEALNKRNDLYLKGILKYKSDIIVKKILNSSDFKNTQNIGLYYPIKGEIDLLNLLCINNKNYYFPKCVGLDLEFVKYEKKFIKDKYDIPIPTGSSIDLRKLDIIFVPALIANSRKYRLGYGKGYYDRFFSKNNLKAKKIIVVSKEFISDNFVEEDFDVNFDEIISA